ncbi:hypothetical protein ZWY2020_020737 [Hordeum vulgare]|nr:hypothetical protein ZWY2020_020737 [Hordeum vulgare]
MESSSTAAASARHAEGGAAEGEYEEVLVRLSSLITQKILELEEPIARMKVIHVANTKGKVNHLMICNSLHCRIRVLACQAL